MADIKDAPENMLRSWADAGVISSARYVEEIDRRAGRIAMTAPPLDYALDDELAIPGLDAFEDPDAETVPAPPALMWITGIIAVLFVIALVMVLR